MDDGFGLAEIILWAVVHGFAHSVGGYLVERMRDRGGGEHPLDEPIRGLAYQAQETIAPALVSIAESLEAIAAQGKEDEPPSERPKRGAR